MTGPTQTSIKQYTFLWRRPWNDRWYPKGVSASSLEQAVEEVTQAFRAQSAALKEIIVIDHSVYVVDADGEDSRASIKDLKLAFPIEFANKVHTITPLQEA